MFFLVIIVLLGFVIYQGSVALFLQAKNEMLDRDLNRIWSEATENVSLSVYDYWLEHPDLFDYVPTTEEEEEINAVLGPISEMTDEIFQNLQRYHAQTDFGYV